MANKKTKTRVMSGSRPIDRSVEESLSLIGKSYTYIKKKEVATWKGALAIFFAAGFAAALIWTAKNNNYEASMAAGEGGSNLTFSSQTPSSVAAGETFSVNVLVTPGTGETVTGVDVTVKYSNADLRLDSITATSSAFPLAIYAGGVITQDADTGIGTGRYAAGNVSGVTTANSIVATYNFTALRAGTSALSFNETEYTGASDYVIRASVVDAGGTVVTGTLGTASVTVAPVPVSTYTVGGSVSGLGSGKSVVLQNNGGDNLTVLVNGSFTFATPIDSGSTYAVTVNTEPSGQTCSVTNGTGTISANVSNVTVTCADIPVNSYSIGGSISGLLGTVVLQNNGGDDLSRTTNESFTFSTAIADGNVYAVTIKTQPYGQTCSVTNGSGTVSGANVTNIAVACTGTPTFTVGGTISGLSGTVVLANNGGDNLSRSSNGSFLFATALDIGDAYAVSVVSQPSGQTCSVTNATGTIALANISGVVVTCTTNPIVCTDYSYGNWGACINGISTRTATGIPSGCTGGLTAFTSQSCTVTATTTTSSTKKKKKKKKKTTKYVIANTPTKVKRWGVLVQSGTKFTPNNTVALYFEKSPGVYYPPRIVRTDAKGKFSIAFRVNKPAGKYKWYAVNSRTGAKSKIKTYTVK